MDWIPPAEKVLEKDENGPTLLGGAHFGVAW